jgi:hypothetical protein
MVYANAPADNPLDQSPILVKLRHKKRSIELLLAAVKTGLRGPEDLNKHKNSRYSRGR